MIKTDSVKISAKKNCNLKEYIISKYGIRSELSDFTILKKSLDARDKNDIKYVYSVAFRLDEKEEKYLVKKFNNISFYEPFEYKVLERKSNKDLNITVCGMGPAGLFAAILLTEAGFKPIIIDRGKCIADRVKDVEDFFEKGILDINSNIQFGEGGAGTFSDGKLNTGIKDKEGRKEFVLKTFVKYGADNRILYDSKPHIGTDVLREVIVNIRKDLENKGSKFLFSSEFVSFKEKDGNIKEIDIKDLKSGKLQTLPCDRLILAIGHSSRDTIEYLSDKLPMEAKPFAMGFRVIHEQSFIDKSQYGENYNDIYEGLEPSPYKLTYQGKERGVYSFCMCPGGYVVNASSEANRTCVNGMSEFKRDSGFANSAIIVQINKEDLREDDVLSGMKFQREVEENAYKAGKGSIPVCSLESFFGDLTKCTAKDDISKSENEQSCSDNVLNKGSADSIKFDECPVDPEKAVMGRWNRADLTGIYPFYINSSFASAILEFDRIIDGFAKVNPLIAGVEARSSSPVKILRNADFESAIKGIFPCGEGAGYAGGIVSAAIDGMKVAEKIITN